MSTELKRCLTLWEIVIYGVGLILGAGIYVLIGAVSGIAGNMVWLSFLMSAIVAGFTAMSYAELSTIFPKSGAEFVYAKHAFGSDGIAWMVGFFAVMVSFITVSAVAIGFAGYLGMFFPAIDLVWLALGLIAVMSAVNFWGIKQSARFNILATSIEVGGLLLVIFVGGYFIFMGAGSLADLTEFPVKADGTPSGFMPIISAGALIFFAFMGFEDIANIAEEAENPTKILPRAFIYSLLISTVIYVLVAVVAISIVPYQELGQSEQPLSLVMEKLIGGAAPSLIGLIALFATANTVLVALIVGARMLYGMARERSLPGMLAKVHKGRQTPWVAIVMMAIISAIFLGFKKIEVLASISNVGIFLLFFSVNLSNIFLRYRKPDLERPWKVPLSIGSFPIISALGAISCIMMLFALNEPVDMFGTQVSSLVVGLVIFALAFPLYFLLGRRREA